MNFDGKIFLALLLLLALFPESYSEVANQNQVERFVGWIEEIRGDVYLKPNRSSPQVKLRQKGMPRFLYAGERLQCGPAGYIRFRLYDKVHEIKGLMDKPSSWYPIPYVPAKVSDIIQEAMRQFARIGGRERGTESTPYLVSPADGTVVKPDQFTIRWSDSRREQFISLMVLDDENVLWQQQNIKSRVGQLVSDSLRKALSHHRDKGAAGNLRLRLIRADHSTTQALFTLLSSENERNLLKELEIWNQEKSSVLRHAGRALSFSNQGLLTETVEEYEAALDETPESQDLLLVTIRANRKIGNMPRVAELTKRLASGKKTSL
jgi:hypothetical protein